MSGSRVLVYPPLPVVLWQPCQARVARLNCFRVCRRLLASTSCSLVPRLVKVTLVVPLLFAFLCGDSRYNIGCDASGSGGACHVRCVGHVALVRARAIEQQRADGGSREGVRDHMAASLQVPLQEAPLPASLSDVFHLRPVELLRRLESRGGVLIKKSWQQWARDGNNGVHLGGDHGDHLDWACARLHLLCRDPSLTHLRVSPYEGRHDRHGHGTRHDHK